MASPRPEADGHETQILPGVLQPDGCRAAVVGGGQARAPRPSGRRVAGWIGHLDREPGHASVRNAPGHARSTPARPSATTPAGLPSPATRSRPARPSGCRWVPAMSARSAVQTTRTRAAATRRRASRQIRHLEDRHVAAVATAALQITASGSSGLNRRHDLDERVARGEHGVGEPEPAYARIVERLRPAERFLQLPGRSLAVGGDQRDLAQTRPSEHARTVPRTGRSRPSQVAP